MALTVDGDIMSMFTGLNKKSDEAGFLAVYPRRQWQPEK